MGSNDNYGLVTVTVCPYCGYELDAATDAHFDKDDVKLVPGDISVCIGCTGVLEFDAQLKPCAVADTFMSGLVPEERVFLERMIAAILESKR